MKRKKLLRSEVVELFNTTVETLRHYEEKGILTPEIGNNSYRYYGFKDLQKLRQIFMFRDLDISLEKMKQLDKGLFSKAEYIKLLKVHRLTLEHKIERLQGIQANILQVIDLLEKGESKSSYLLRYQSERKFYLLNLFEADSISSPKAYYDRHQSLIKTSGYSERSLQIIYDYDSLDTGEINAQLCIELPVGEDQRVFGGIQADLLILPKGSYLSVFYPFKQGRFDTLSRLKEEIDLYLKDNCLLLNGNNVLEREHPELSLLLDDDTSVYEIQIRVRNRCNRN